MQQRPTELKEIVADFNTFFSEIDRKTRKKSVRAQKMKEHC